ncbi:DUF1648 domain-containing protein [Haloarcula halophila]|uniref:DUF1648 domain-containing protein n=1 Tax=Haloarcula TaxID=2237 RepID=UPI0023E3B5E7|nr:DUF1648 domain-containing protein [Halomicroarcula sp. DFY41]
MPRYRPADALNVGIVLLTALLGVALWPRLPAEMAIHFSASGVPDNYVPKAVGVALLPAIMLAVFLFVKTAFSYDPPSDSRVPTVVTVATTGFLGALHALVLAWNVGYPVPMDSVLVGALVWAVALCGYVYRREGVSLT